MLRSDQSYKMIHLFAYFLRYSLGRDVTVESHQALAADGTTPMSCLQMKRKQLMVLCFPPFLTHYHVHMHLFSSGVPESSTTWAQLDEGMPYMVSTWDSSADMLCFAF